MSFVRLGRADAVAMVAALALLFVMAADWYSTTSGEAARRTEEITEPRGAEAGEIARGIDERARIAAEEAERNAWQADGAIDRVILILLLAAVLLALLSGFVRAAGRRVAPPLTPAALGGLAAGAAALLVAYRTWQEPGFDEFNTVQPAVPLAILVLGILALALAMAVRAEESGAAWTRIDEVDARESQRQAAPGT
jgi:hypothetical protein